MIPEQLIADLRTVIPNTGWPTFLYKSGSGVHASTCKESAGSHPYNIDGKVYIVIIDENQDTNLPKFLAIAKLFGIRPKITKFTAQCANVSLPCCFIEGWCNKNILTQEICRFWYRDVFYRTCQQTNTPTTINEFLQTHYLRDYLNGLDAPAIFHTFFLNLKANVSRANIHDLKYAYASNGITDWINYNWLHRSKIS